MKKRGPRPNYQAGAFGGLLAYQYGDRSGRPVYRPGITPPPAPVVNSDQHRRLVEQTAEILSSATTTKFEHEGACRAGLRAEWCLKGYDWRRSDTAAAKVVSDALNKIGARRPTWEQGQREYTEALERCSWCKGPIPDELFFRPTPARYCSELCARSAMQHRDFEDRRTTDRAYRAASEVVQAHRNPTKSCPCCSKRFRARHKDQVYCSESCANRHRPAVQVTTSICRCCGTPFPSTYDAMFCGPNCRSKFAMLGSGRWKPKRLVAVVFDYFLTVSINSRPPWLTAERFDEAVGA